MGVNFPSKNDYSVLFSSLNNSTNSGANSMNSLLSSGALSDHASIKNGSYGKLLKAYYAKDGRSEELSAIANKKDRFNNKNETANEGLTKVRSSVSELKKNADEMLEIKPEEDKISAKAIKGFVDSYNKTLDSVEKLDNKSIGTKNDNLIKLTKNYEKELNEIGISINKDNKLSIDNEKLSAASADKVNSLFTGIGSYGYSVSNQATIIDNQAAYEGLKNDTYVSNGLFSGNNSVGRIWDDTV